MIEPMKKVYLVVQTARKRQMLKALRKAGIVHVQDAPKPVHSGKADEIGKQAENYARIESALLEFGDKYKKFILNDIRSKYGAMLAQGATTFWETEKGWRDFDNAGSLCHGWSALPVYYLSKLKH